MKAFIGGIEPIKFDTKDGKHIEGYHLHMTSVLTVAGSRGYANIGKIFVRDISGICVGDEYDVRHDRYGKLKGRKIEGYNEEDHLPF